MRERAPFDESRPFDAIAQMTKNEIAQACTVAWSNAQNVESSEMERLEAFLIGMIVGACGGAMSMATPETHRELRSILIEMIPGCFDQAREICGLAPLGYDQ